MKKITVIEIKIPAPAWTYNPVRICCLKSSSVSSSCIHIVGTKNPTAAPRAWAATQTVIAITLSFDANQVAANFAGTLDRNG